MFIRNYTSLNDAIVDSEAEKVAFGVGDWKWENMTECYDERF